MITFGSVGYITVYIISHLFPVAGEVISRKKEELDKIVSAFNIQLDNPVTILNREDVREFLNSSSSQKYKFFMEARKVGHVQSRCHINERSLPF